MPSEPIPPALTSSEWATFPNWPEGIRGVGTGAPLYFPTKHGIAAVNLWKEPFGFTQNDLRALDRAINPDAGFAAGEYGAWESQVRSLANRIRSLLPPSESL